MRAPRTIAIQHTAPTDATATAPGTADQDAGGTALGTAAPQPTFFDGTYGSNAEAGDVKTKFSSIPRWRFVYNTALVVLDAVMMLAAYTLVLIILPNVHATVEGSLAGGSVQTGLTFALVWVLCLLFVKSYERHTMGEGYALYTKLMTAALANFIVLCSVAYFFAQPYPRWLVGLSCILSGVFTIIERWLMRRSLHRNRKKGEYNYPTVIVGSPDGICKTIDKLSTDNGLSMGYAPFAVCPIERVGNENDPDAPQHLISVPFAPRNEHEETMRVLTLNSHLAQTAKHLGANVVLVADVLTRDSETMRTLSLAVESANMELALSASVADLGGGRLVMRNNPSMPILSANLPQYSWTTRLLKRTLDILGSLVALIPGGILIGLAAIAIKLEDGGPVFYKQERIGIYGKPFHCLKIRSMRVDADKMDAEVAKAAGVELGATFKVKNDPRITRVGKFIRKTSIDEIPQFINVLRGDMSLVGPRPQRQYEVDQYSSLYSTRLLVRPGITGPWQIGGRNDLSQEDAEFLDVNYVENWSVMTDIAILIKTVGVVLRGDGAY
ncbi:undecaprenyl-phosphate galactosephosphotransferase [Bifidobacterium ramosum]|uniref:Exopolysaccharide biosynthesis polyprenyl glycosylphosphotransferase n=1 Tax=Bifidobacterium ramosum TaxID=1798158 RepID=A0A6L4WYS4_9BIFI|nr:sugar transferase [Bifidobacterium ramosum]KAB8287242.1 undecaprenyl-phosphate galactosephosphotransferase [Bifidobacterium ramosum]NEG71953.1 exopolysaccharide biosynthesis polyprenyl glycosylphosphotransferase [Bifidobacterium ramosum]